MGSDYHKLRDAMVQAGARNIEQATASAEMAVRLRPDSQTLEEAIDSVIATLRQTRPEFFSRRPKTRFKWVDG
jgi:hypothetical protein